MQPPGPSPSSARFPWQDTAEQLDDFALRFPQAGACARGRSFVDADSGARLVLPFVLPPPTPGEAVTAFAARAGTPALARPGPHVVVLLQAGAMALGYWDDDELLLHKAQKRYVVRGRGKAQPLHLRTRGKSRYGSRLRLQNWRRLLGECSERLRAWWDDPGPARQVFVAIPPRAQAALFAGEPPPPFGADDPRLRRIPRHVHVPDHRELLAVRRWLGRGRLVLPAAD
ncbi:MAG: hypothetical protein AB7O97_08280 [Planctomycetota bacterium]